MQERGVPTLGKVKKETVQTTCWKVLNRGNLNKAYKQVKSNHGAPGIDGMTVEKALPWLRKNRDDLLQSIREGTYKPSPVRRKEIPKPDGCGVRKLGIPTVVDRVIQQAIAQQLQPLFEPLFSDGSCGYRPGRSAQQAIRRVKAYAEQGYGYAVEPRPLEVFYTLNHELLMNLLRKQIRDKRVTELIKKHLKRILQSWNEWLRRRMRMYIWKQWKKPRTKVQNLQKLGVPEWQAYPWGNTRLGYWRIAGSAILQRSITNEKLAQAGYYDFPAKYERLRHFHLNG
ncbi:reverse transcriptase domain-containing protein [Paenibacillus sp. DMB20]|uniref:reverse transcriptase domain-containing protein n=1 Tax=Paenibacillus sp. DMB20 TaxID=1642570 RepID=UPI00069B0BA6|nr:reverse transcriptase domain-containing protein [Paenibacillus sp. DMB20]